MRDLQACGCHLDNNSVDPDVIMCADHEIAARATDGEHAVRVWVITKSGHGNFDALTDHVHASESGARAKAAQLQTESDNQWLRLTGSGMSLETFGVEEREVQP